MTAYGSFHLHPRLDILTTPDQSQPADRPREDREDDGHPGTLRRRAVALVPTLESHPPGRRHMERACARVWLATVVQPEGHFPGPAAVLVADPGYLVRRLVGPGLPGVHEDPSELRCLRLAHRRTGVAVVAGTQAAEDKMLERLGEPNAAQSREDALRKALSAWSVGAREVLRRQIGGKEDEEDLLNPLRDIDEAEADGVFLRDELKNGRIEVGLLERRANRESRFRLLADADLESLVGEYR